MKRKCKVDTNWCSDFAYAVGLITADGNLSPDGRHINFTTKDKELAEHFRDALGLDNKIGRKSRSVSQYKSYYVVQFGDVNFYEFLLRIGLTPAKSRTLSSLNIPEEYFADFLRGCIDGDGNIDVFAHSESSHPQLRLRLYSASYRFLEWMQVTIVKNFETKGRGWITASPQKGVHALLFGKADSRKILKLLYQEKNIRLARKFEIAQEFLT